jgi:phage shock protein A
MLIHMRASSTLDALEDPIETLDYAYNQQQELLREVNRGLVEVVTAKEQLRQQAARLRGRIPELDRQARQALEAEREDLARLALERKQFALTELSGLEQQVIEISDEERRLTLAQQRLSTRVDEFRTHRTVLTARHGASAAQLRVHQALAGVSGEFTELGIAVGRAEEKIDRLRSRATALDTLIASGTLTLPGSGGDPIERELRDLAVKHTVDSELAALRADLEASNAPTTAPPPASAPPPAAEEAKEPDATGNPGGAQ